MSSELVRSFLGGVPTAQTKAVQAVERREAVARAQIGAIGRSLEDAQMIAATFGFRVEQIMAVAPLSAPMMQRLAESGAFSLATVIMGLSQ